VSQRKKAFIGLWVLAMALVALVVGIHAYNKVTHTFSDWVVFEVGARVLVHYHHATTNLYTDPRLHLYVDNNDIQVGPPALWFVAAFEWLSARTIYGLFSVIMAALTLGGTCAALVGGRRLAAAKTTSFRNYFPIVLASLVTVWLLTNDADRWKHLDDVMALSFAAVAAWLIAEGRAWWLVGVLLGTGIAAKPWALILAPMLLALPRRDLSRTVLTTIVVASAWWAPFVLAAPGTIQALGQYQILPTSGSILHLLGITGGVEHWLRPVQFFLGLAVGGFVAMRRRWAAAPLAALATRVLTDPYAYGYYGMGPLLFAFFYDAAGGGWRGLPVFTAFTAVMEFAVPFATHNGTVIALAKLVWAVSVLAAVLIGNRPPPEEEATVVRERPQASLA
jgi:hypothetical protein